VDDWELEDIELAAAKKPESFFIARREEREGQQPGAMVRLHFILKNPEKESPRAERMWVEVMETTSNGEYVGVLTNAPRFLKHIQQGSVLKFSSKHIAQIFIRKTDPRWIECGEKKALVSKMVFEPGQAIRFVYREDADDGDDSGWRLFAGHESQEYMDNPDNIRVCDVDWLLDFDPTIEAILRSPIGSVYEREDKPSDWQKVTDWNPPED